MSKQNNGHCCNHTDEKEKAGQCCRAAKPAFDGEKKKDEPPALIIPKDEKPAHKGCGHKPS